MKTNHKGRLLAVAIFVIALMFAPVTFAYANVTGDTGQQAQAEEPLPAETETGAQGESITLTPEGNMTVVDDISGDAATEKQFITVITESGNYFYIVIDRAGGTQNVHFLKLVSEEDLLAITQDGEAVGEQTPTQPEPEIDPVEPVALIDTQTEPEEESESNNTLGILALTLIAALLVGGAVFYFKVLRPKQAAKNNGNINDLDLDDLDFEDEDRRFSEWIDEIDEPAADEPYPAASEDNVNDTEAEVRK